MLLYPRKSELICAQLPYGKIDSVKFLHISDIHLGCTRYQLAESPRDFYEAWLDVLNRYAVAEKVDFVIMCGDFFTSVPCRPRQ